MGLWKPSCPRCRTISHDAGVFPGDPRPTVTRNLIGLRPITCARCAHSYDAATDGVEWVDAELARP